MNIFDELDIEFRPESQYYCKCPKCSESRHKQGTKSLSVSIEGNKVSVLCFHPGCEWEKSYQFTNNDEMPEIKKIEKIQEGVITDEGQLPEFLRHAGIHNYFNRNKEKVLVVQRIEKSVSRGKIIRPFIISSETGEWYSHWPVGKVLYRSELLSDKNYVLVVEGERTADISSKLFTKADVVTWPAGCKNVEKGDWELLRDRTVVLWPDADEAGIEAMKKIAELIPSNKVYLIDPVGLEKGTDLADNIPIEKIKELWNAKKLIENPCTLEGICTTDDADKEFEDDDIGLPFGYDSMDRYVRLYPGVTVIPGRTNHGKSTVLINLAYNLIDKQNAIVIYLSYEMSKRSVLLRMTKVIDGTKYSNIGFEDDKIYQTQIKNKTSEAYKKIKQYIHSGNFVLSAGRSSLNDVIKYMQTYKDHQNPVVLMIDYIQLMPHQTKNQANRYLEIKEMVEKLNSLANENKQYIIMGSQLTSGEMPAMDVAREGKDIKFIADAEFKIWNKNSARITETFRKVGKEMVDYYDKVEGEFIIEVTKSRQGAEGKCFGFRFSNGQRLVEATSKFRGDF